MYQTGRSTNKIIKKSSRLTRLHFLHIVFFDYFPSPQQQYLIQAQFKDYVVSLSDIGRARI